MTSETVVSILRDDYVTSNPSHGRMGWLVDLPRGLLRYTMKIGIIGGRGFEDAALVERCIDSVLGPMEDDCLPVVFLGGGSKGAERIASEHVTGNLGHDYVLFKPYNMIDTKTPHDPKYFYFRNKQIVDNSDVMIVFDDEEERNLAKTIHYIQNATHKDYHIYYLDGTSVHRDEVETTKAKVQAV